jgi:transposase
MQAVLRVSTPSGLWQVLRRLGLHYKRARDYLHSPDPHYTRKQDTIAHYLQKARENPARYAFFHLDELTFYRQPTIASAYARKGTATPLARRSYRSNTSARIIAAMNAVTGQVTYLMRSRTSVSVLRQFYARLRQAYATTEQLYVAQDNWPVHAHPDVLAVLEPQEYPWFPKLPGNWPTAPRDSLPTDDLPIQLLFQPTYAPWTNPIEKLWRWLHQDHLHLHRFSDDWSSLKQRVCDFLDGFAKPSPDLLRYVGLLPN